MYSTTTVYEMPINNKYTLLSAGGHMQYCLISDHLTSEKFDQLMECHVDCSISFLFLVHCSAAC